jgi:hypothetical protein
LLESLERLHDGAAIGDVTPAGAGQRGQAGVVAFGINDADAIASLDEALGQQAREP